MQTSTTCIRFYLSYGNYLRNSTKKQHQKQQYLYELI